MVDYFDATAAPGGEANGAVATNGAAAAPATTGGDIGMDDEIMV